MNNIKFLLVAFLFPINLTAQHNYVPLQCIGDVPEDFRLSTREKVKSDITNESQVVPNKNVSKTKRNFFLESNFLLNDLLLSGSVLYGDSLTVYINKVADKLLKNDPDLRGKVRFYTVKSTEVNAFATDPGMIFVTVGLLAELENEAQLAYILSHEIIHFQNRHVINSYIQAEQISRSGRSRSTDDKVKLISSYSKENELEADSLGYLLFCKSEYNQKEALNTLDIIQFSHLPLDEIHFSNKIFENKFFVFNEKYSLDSLKEISLLEDDKDDTYSTHPNIRKRRSQLFNQSESATGSGAIFLLDENYFKSIQNISRKELLYLYGLNGNYMKGYYDAFVMSSKNPNDVYYKEMMAKFMYGMAKYKNNNNYSDVARYYKKIEGESQQAYYFFYTLSKAELNSIASIEAYNQCKLNKNPFMKRLRNDLLAEMVSKHNLSLAKINEAVTGYDEYLKKEEEKSKTDTVNVVIDSSSIEKLSKYDKLRQQKEKKRIEKKEIESFKDFYLLAYADIASDSEFTKLLSNIQDSVEHEMEKEKEKEAKLSKMSRSQKAKYYAEEEKHNKKYSKINLNKLIVVDPYYFEADSRKGLELLNSEEGTNVFNKNIEKCGTAADIDVVMLSTKELGTDETDKFNDISTLNNFYEEWNMHDSKKMICLQAEYIPELTRKYNTSYFNYTGLVTIKERRTGKLYYLVLGAITWPVFPIMAVVAFTPIRATEYDSVIFDLDLNEPINSYSVELKTRSNNSYIKSQIYYQLITLKK